MAQAPARRNDAQIVLPGIVDITTTSLVLAPTITQDDYLEVGRQLAHIDSGRSWWIGDWWVNDVGWGEKEETAEAVGLDFGSCRNVGSVARRFKQLSRRRDNLTFKHHVVVLKLDDGEQDHWLDQAEEHRWSAAVLKREIEADRQRRMITSGDSMIPTITLAHYADWLDEQPDCDLILTDPPYITDVEDISAFAADWLPRALKKLKPTGRAYVCVGAYPEEIDAYLTVARPTQILVWTYENTLGPSPSLDYKLNWQAILYYRGSEAAALACPTMLEQFSVQDIPAPDGRQGDRWHRWQKPLELGERLVRHGTEPGGLVLDPFAGSGTFLVAAGMLGREAHGCDIDPEAIAIAVNRGVQQAPQ